MAIGFVDGLGLKSRAVRRDIFFLLVIALIGAVIAVAVGQYALYRVSRAQLDNYTSALLKQSADVASVSIETLALVGKSQETMCSDTDLNAMRYLVFQRKELYDIGRVANGALVCTANWGKFPAPLKLPPLQRQEANGDLLWRRVPHVADSRLIVDMASHGSAIVFTSPTIFENYERFDPAFSSIVLTRDGQHIYRSLGNTTGLLKHFRKSDSGWEFSSRITSSGCAASVDVCIVTGLSHVNMWSRSPMTTLEVAGIGGLAACGFGMLMIRRRQQQSVPAEQLRRALADGRLGLVYQPLVLLKSKRMVGVEALLRVRDEKGEVVPADIIVKIAEKDGLIGDVTRIVVRKALTEMRERLTGKEDFSLNINVSVSDVIDPAFHRYLEKETERLRIPCDRVVLELTERSAADEEKLLFGVTMLRNLGYGLYIDDLGTGYSSLAYLSKLPINGIKVDKIFTQSIGKEAVNSIIVEKICSIADTLGVAVVIEGIERHEQIVYIRELAPDAIGQGCIWGMPVSAEQLASLQKSWEAA